MPQGESNPRSPQLEKARTQRQRPNAAKNNKQKKKKPTNLKKQYCQFEKHVAIPLYVL